MKRKFTFFSINTKNASSHVLKMSEISLLLYTHEFSDIFIILDEIYLVFTSKKVINIVYYIYQRKYEYYHSSVLTYCDNLSPISI